MFKYLASIILACGGCVSTQQASATNYGPLQCPATGMCDFFSAPLSAPFNDTLEFTLPRQEMVTVLGGRICIGVSGHARSACDFVYVDSATLDGVPMTPPPTGCPPGSAISLCYTWTATGEPGAHTIAVSGHIVDPYKQLILQWGMRSD